MSAFAKSVVISIIGLLFAVVLGVQLGEGDWGLPILILIGCAGTLLYLFFFRSVQIEAPIVGFLLFGYIVGNRGFAQISLGGPGTPLFLGEVGLAVCLGVLGLRMAVRRERPIPNLQLAWIIVALLILGGARLYLDAVMRVNKVVPITAVRDSATIYYALFFFIVYRLGQRAPDRRFLERWIYFGCLALLPVVAVQFFAPEFFFKVTFRGVPVVYPKGDLLATFLGFSSFYLFLKPGSGTARMFSRGLSVAMFASMLALMSRASFVGVAAAALLLLRARQPKFVMYQIVMGGCALLALGLLKISNVHGDSEMAAKLADKVQSITDVSGTGSYRSRTGQISSSNNQYRLVWWQSVFNETMEKGPVFGLGFGADLAKSFVREYYGNRATDTSVRSPHSIWFTILGRLGLVGLAVFATIALLILRGALAAARLVAAGHAPPFTLAHWCAVLSLLGSASFGVVLEGPMGGILFWSFLGLAASQAAPRLEPRRIEKREAETWAKHHPELATV